MDWGAYIVGIIVGVLIIIAGHVIGILPPL